MSLPVILRHGTKAQMDSYGPMQAGEVGFTTDEGFVYGSDGSANYLIGRAISGSSDPITPRAAGLLYVNTTTSGMFFSTGASWLPVGNSRLGGLSGNLDDIADGSTYKRVKATEIVNGYINQINDGVHLATASGVSTHLADQTIHRSINDSSITSTNLWSATKVNETIHSLIDGLDYQNSVLSKTVSTPPGSPSEGARYIIAVGATDAWSGKDNDVAEYRSAAWVYITPNKGYCCAVEDDSNKEWVYNGTTWIVRPATEDHNSLINKQGGSGSDFYHLGLVDFNALVTNRTQTIQNTVSGMVSAGTQTGIVVSEVAGALNFSINLSDTTPSTTTSGAAVAGSSPNVSRADHQHKIGLHNFFGPEHQIFGGSPGYLVGTSDGTLITWITKIDGGTF